MISSNQTASQENSYAVIFLANGPGELTTWVRPLAEKLHKTVSMRPKVFNAKTSLKLVLVPCPNATGKEADVAKQWGLFEKIKTANQFWKLLICPKKFGEWPSKGIVVFLGGDQFWSVLLSAKLGYRHITYAEWIARWPQWNDRIAAMSEKVRDQLPKKYRNKCNVVGDLMADLSSFAKEEIPLPKGEWIALLPGSKPAKLSVGVPFLLETADRLALIRPNCKFLLSIAPTTNIKEIEKFNSSCNPIASKYKSEIYNIKPSQNINQPWKRLITKAGTEIFLQEIQPAHGPLSQCDIALTTIGANTAELAALGVPMIVIVPTQHIFVMQAWDGLFGLLARLPGFRRFISFIISTWRLRNKGFLAWPNINAGRMIVPERVGKILPQEIAKETHSWLASNKLLEGQKNDLQNLRGKPGAVNNLAKEIKTLLEEVTISR